MDFKFETFSFSSFSKLKVSFKIYICMYSFHWFDLLLEF